MPMMKRIIPSVRLRVAFPLSGSSLIDNFIMLQKNCKCYIFLSSLIGLSATAQKGDYIREKFGSVGVVYLELRA